MAVYLDEPADDGQRQALGGIHSGALGGPPAMLAGLISEQLGVTFVPITFETHHDTRRVTVPGIMDFEVTGIRATGSDAVMRLQHIFHPMGPDLPIAQSSIGTFSDPDYGWSFDNAGKNGH
ncbi:MULTISPECIES: DUF1326 domain-containing protein [unclassified Arthrobacter]|uniref:DUF1326 domain-containing protein n=1 Tax=unclassified Arthrobacter TaxID=235627 RepID=UPI00339A5EEA